MKIGEYLVKEGHITEYILEEALTIQRQNENMLLGEIIVKMKELSREDLEKHIEAYLIMCRESVLNETSQWLGQDEVDDLSTQFFEREYNYE
jgi:hypothetical protein